MTVVPFKSRTDIIVDRIDAHLANLPPESHLGFLTDQWTTWQTRYGRFIAYTAMGRSMPCEVGRAPATAWDYIETLAEIAKRLSKVTDLAKLDGQLAAVSEEMA